MLLKNIIIKVYYTVVLVRYNLQALVNFEELLDQNMKEKMP